MTPLVKNQEVDLQSWLKLKEEKLFKMLCDWEMEDWEMEGDIAALQENAAAFVATVGLFDC